MDNSTGTVLLILWAAVCIGLPVATRATIIDSPGGREGDEINVHCRIRNIGRSVFYRHDDDKNVTLSPSSKYDVLRYDHVGGEDSVMIIIKASELDSGTYGCAPNVSGNIHWEVSRLTNVTVKPACSGADYTIPPSLTTEPKEQGQNKHSTQQSSENTGLIAAVVFLSLLALTLFIALAVVSRKLFHKQMNNRPIPYGGVPGERGAVDEDGGGNATQLSDVTTFTINPT